MCEPKQRKDRIKGKQFIFFTYKDKRENSYCHSSIQPYVTLIIHVSNEYYIIHEVRGREMKTFTTDFIELKYLIAANLIIFLSEMKVS